MVAHEKRNSAQLFCAVPTRNDLALSSLLFPAQPTQKLGYPASVYPTGRSEARGRMRSPAAARRLRTTRVPPAYRVCAMRVSPAYHPRIIRISPM